ncbi:MAG: AAA family ATPase [Candidatus Melainabacteria bacterium]|nr:AAA family ATPase [Candidatus Melainabacteria bacterium]
MNAEESKVLVGLLVNLGYGVLLVLMLVAMFRSLGQQNQFSRNVKSAAKKIEPDKAKVTFADLAGLDEVKTDMQLFVACLKNTQTLTKLGGRPPKGILLVGPPGTGKTLLAKAVAGEAGVPFFSVSGSEFVEMFVGVGAKRVREMFEKAKEVAPAILFIDEIDAVGQHRGAGIGYNNDEREQTLNQLLTEMDGFEGSEGLIIIAATNRPDKLDPALLRPGRFDREVTVSVPDRAGRLELLTLYSNGVPLAADVNLEALASDTAGMTGADIAAMFKVHAPVNALKRGGSEVSEVSMADLSKAVWDSQAGAATEGKSRRLSHDVKKLLAIHEGGHAIVGHYLSTRKADWKTNWGDPVSKITIIGAGAAGGYTAFATSDENNFPTRERLLGMITTALAGNMAEHIFLSTTTTGAQNDFDKAYSLAKLMVTQVGMSELGPISVGANGSDPFLGKAIGAQQGYGLGEESSNQIDHEIKKILDDCKERAARILEDPTLTAFLKDQLVSLLLEKETILLDEWAALWQENCSNVAIEI